MHYNLESKQDCSSKASLSKTPVQLFQYWTKDSTESAVCSNMSTGPVDIYVAKRSERHLLITIETN